MVEIILNRSVSGIFEGKGYTFGKGSKVFVSMELAKDLCQSHNATMVVKAKPAAKGRNKAISKAKKETR